jgi:hypothetical protein
MSITTIEDFEFATFGDRWKVADGSQTLKMSHVVEDHEGGIIEVGEI